MRKWSQISSFFHVLTLVESFAYMPLLLTAIPNSFECSYMQTPSWLSVVRANLKLAHYNILKFNLSWKICLVYSREILGRNTSLKYISVTNTQIKWMSLCIIKLTSNSFSWNFYLYIIRIIWNICHFHFYTAVVLYFLQTNEIWIAEYFKEYSHIMYAWL